MKIVAINIFYPPLIRLAFVIQPFLYLFRTNRHADKTCLKIIFEYTSSKLMTDAEVLYIISRFFFNFKMSFRIFSYIILIYDNILAQNTTLLLLKYIYINIYTYIYIFQKLYFLKINARK